MKAYNISLPPESRSTFLFVGLALAAFIVPVWVPFAGSFQETPGFRILLGVVAVAIIFAHPWLRREISEMAAFPIQPFELFGMTALRFAGLTMLGMFGYSAAQATAAEAFPIAAYDLGARLQIAKDAWGGFAAPMFIVATVVDEEVVFRAALFVVLRKLVPGRIMIPIISAVIFASGHLLNGYHSMLFAFVWGVFLMVIVQQGRSLLPAIASHALCNFSVWP